MKKYNFKHNKKIGILSKSPGIYFNARIKEESQKRGIECRVMNPLDFLLYPDKVMWGKESLMDFSHSFITPQELSNPMEFR